MRLSACALVLVAALAGCADSRSREGNPSATGTNSLDGGAAVSTRPTGDASVAPSPAASESVDLAAGWVEAMRIGEPGGWDRFMALVRGRDGFLALGHRIEGGHGGPGVADAYAAVSADGVSWERVERPADVTDYSPRPVLFTLPDDTYVWFGSGPRETPDGPPPPVMLSSPDGRTWEPFETEGLPEDVGVYEVVHGPAGYLLHELSWIGSGEALWLSADGRAWEHVQDAPGQITDIDAGEEGYVVVGERASEADPTARERFTMASSDGRTWVETVDPFAEQYVEYWPTAIVGSFGPDWVATAIDRERRAQFWRSSDGVTWEHASELQIPHEIGSLDAVLVEHDGHLLYAAAAGFEPHPGTWMTTDVSTWEAMDAEAVIAAVVSDGEVTVAVGAIPSADGTAAIIRYRPVD